MKAFVSRHIGRGSLRGAALGAHVAYLGRVGAGLEGARPSFFDGRADDLDAASMAQAWSEDRHHFRFIVSPEYGDRIDDLRAYTRDVMRRVADDLGQPGLVWLATCHFDTDQPHAHILIRGHRSSGKDLVIPRDYIGYGFRLRAQEVAQERLGDLSRAQAEQRIWRETQADRFTALDRRLQQAADDAGLVDDGVSSHEAWTALIRGRLRKLESLGLAIREGRRFRLSPELDRELRTLQLRRDVIRTLNARRLLTGAQVDEWAAGRLRGVVVARGFHDEVGSAPWAVVRDGKGSEHFARLALGQTAVLGRAVELTPGARGAVLRDLARASSLDR